MKTHYDVVVIGAGSGGLTAAVGFAKVGKKVLLVEREHMGGECTNSGCVPSKALLHYAKEYAKQRGEERGGGAGEARPDAAFTYMKQTVAAILAEETPEHFETLGITVVTGEASFTSTCSIAVGETIYHYKHAVIATGSSPRLIDIPGLNPDTLLTNQNLFQLDTPPARLLIVGGGPIGLEMAQAFALLGTKVTIVERGDELARLEDPAIRKIIRNEFDRLGITVITDGTVTNITDNTTAHISDAAGTVHEATFDKLLMAVGRVPNLPPGLDVAKITYDEQCILVDSQHRTSNKYVYAIGDVAQRLKFTHTADDIARQVVARVTSKGLLRVNTRRAVPKVTYTEPEIAQVGMLEAETLAKYGPERIMRIDVPYTMNDRAKVDEAAHGHLTVTVRRLNGAILGANLIGPAAGELIAIFTLAIDHKVSLWQLRRSIYAYPTYSLVVKKAGDIFFAQQLASLKTDFTNLLKRHAPKLIAAVFWSVLIYTFQHYRLSNDLSYQDVLFELLDFFTTTMWGPVVYMALYAVRPLILFPATLLTALSGALFGFWWGVLYTIIGENASANFAYWIGRFFGKDLNLEDTVIGNWVTALRKNSFEAVLLMRLFYVPFDLTNYGSGIVKAKWREYFFATLIGIMPGLTTFVALGAAVDLESFKMDGLTFDAFDPAFLALSVTIFVTSLFLSRFLKRWRAEV